MRAYAEPEVAKRICARVNKEHPHADAWYSAAARQDGTVEITCRGPIATHAFLTAMEVVVGPMVPA